MKKYLNGGLFFGSLVCLFMSLIEISGISVSAFDIIKLSFMGNSGDEWEQLVNAYVLDYLEPLILVIFAIAGVSILGGVLAFVISGKASYVISEIISDVCFLIILLMYIGIGRELEPIQEGLAMWGLRDQLVVSKVTAFLWVGFYLVISAIALSEVFSKKKTAAPVKGDIYAEQFHHTKNPLNYSKPKNMETNYRNVQQKSMPVHNFHGAIIGKHGEYQGKAYPLKEKTKVFFAEAGNRIVVSQYEEENAFAAVYFISEYQEYCVHVLEAKSVYLASGQPLGKGREYYLPRGAEIYVKHSSYLFELA